jgi:alcohol dehydrogenase (NADP+)
MTAAMYAGSRELAGKVPHITLRSGVRMPGIGLGTFGSDRYDAQTVAEAVREALKTGWRLVDCASVYGNEDRIGVVLEEAMESGLSREELFLVSKLWNDRHGPGDVLLSCAQSLRDLRVDTLDLYFVHWPFPNFHPKGAAPDYHNPDASPYVHEAFMKTWRQMERLYRMGLVRHLGVSNMTVPKLRMLLRECDIMPAAVEMELHPTFQQQELFDFCVEHGIQPIGYSPLGSPARPERDRTPQDVVDMEESVVADIARAHGIHPAMVCLKWASQRGQVPIPFSVKPAQMKANLAAVCEDPLSLEEMRAMETVERGCRLIKGQVFLWEGARDWTDLWDLDGRIAGR